MAAALPRFTYNATNLDFATPLKDNNGFQRMVHRDIKYAVSGIQQTSFDYNELIWEVKMTFLTATERNNLLTMWDDWACEGKEWTFIPDYSNSPATTYTVVTISNKFEPKRMARGVDYWEIDFTIRKVIS